MKGVTVRLPEGVIKGIEREAKNAGKDKGTVIREALMDGLARRREDRLMTKYSLGEMSEEEVCAELRVSRWEFGDLLDRRRLHRNVTFEDFLGEARPRDR